MDRQVFRELLFRALDFEPAPAPVVVGDQAHSVGRSCSGAEAGGSRARNRAGGAVRGGTVTRVLRPGPGSMRGPDVVCEGGAIAA